MVVVRAKMDGNDSAKKSKSARQRSRVANEKRLFKFAQSVKYFKNLTKSVMIFSSNLPSG